MKHQDFSFPEFETERLKILKYTLEFVGDAFEFYSDSETMKYAGPDVHNSILDTEKLVKNIIEDKQNNLVYWAIINKEDGKMIGDISLNPDYKHQFASMGFILNKKYLKHGIMTEACFTIMNFAFTQMNFNRIEAQVCTLNDPSIKFIEKLGFVNEGILKQNFLIQGCFYDSYMYAVLKQDFKLME